MDKLTEFVEKIEDFEVIETLKKEYKQKFPDTPEKDMK